MNLFYSYLPLATASFLCPFYNKLLWKCLQFIFFAFMLEFTPIKFLLSLRHWSGSCQGHCWPSFCKIKCFYPVFNLFDDLTTVNLSLFLEASYFLHLASEINHYLGSSIILLVFPSKLFNDFISLTAKAKVLTMAHKALFFYQSLFCLKNFVLQLILSFPSFLPFWLLCFLCTGQVCTYLRAFALAVPPPRTYTWIVPLLPSGFYSSYTLSMNFQLSLCFLFYLTFFFRVYHHLTYNIFTFKIGYYLSLSVEYKFNGQNHQLIPCTQWPSIKMHWKMNA